MRSLSLLTPRRYRFYRVTRKEGDVRDDLRCSICGVVLNFEEIMETKWDYVVTGYFSFAHRYCVEATEGM